MVKTADSQPVGAEQRLQELGIDLPAPNLRRLRGNRAVRTTAFSALCCPVANYKPKYVGRLGKELDAKSGRDALYTASMNALSAARAHLGSLDKVTGVVRLGIYLATSGDFFEHPYVADAASELFEGIFGKEKTSVRMVLGVASLPLGIPVEPEVIPEVTE